MSKVDLLNLPKIKKIDPFDIEYYSTDVILLLTLPFFGFEFKLFFSISLIKCGRDMFDIRIYILQDISKRESVMDRLLKVLLAGLEFGDEKA